MRRVTRLLGLSIGFIFGVCAASAALGEDFYKGKTLTFIVGASPGGGYDTYTRLVARHIGKHIPGNPATIVQNMPGAGMLISANYIYRKAKPDGLTIAVFNNSLIVQKGLGDPMIRIDFRKLGWVGAPSVGEPLCLVMGFTGLKTLDDVLQYKGPLLAGSTRAGSTGYDVPVIMNKTMGTNIQVVPGYGGTAPVRVAMQARELNFFCSNWESVSVTGRSMLEAEGDMKLIPVVSHSHLKDPLVKGLPLFRDVIKGEKNLAIYNAWMSQMDFQRPLSVPPDTPKERLELLRTAFKATLEDPELLAEANKAGLVITYVSGKRVEELVDEILSFPPDIVEELSFLVRKK